MKTREVVPIRRAWRFASVIVILLFGGPVLAQDRGEADRRMYFQHFMQDAQRKMLETALSAPTTALASVAAVPPECRTPFQVGNWRGNAVLSGRENSSINRDGWNLSSTASSRVLPGTGAAIKRVSIVVWGRPRYAGDPENFNIFLHGFKWAGHDLDSKAGREIARATAASLVLDTGKERTTSEKKPGSTMTLWEFVWRRGDRNLFDGLTTLSGELTVEQKPALTFQFNLSDFNRAIVEAEKALAQTKDRYARKQCRRVSLDDIF